MDDKTRKVLGGISAKAPLKPLTKTVVDTELEEAARRALKDPNVRANKERLAKMIDEGHFRRSEEVTDEDAIKEIDDYNTREVKAAIARGDIPDPADDPFVKEREWRQKNKDPNAVSSYQSLMAGIKASRKITPLHDYVLVQFIPRPEKPGAIIIPDSAKQKAMTIEAVVFRIGAGVKTPIKEGQRVLVRAYEFEPIEHEKTLFMIGKEEGVLGFV